MDTNNSIYEQALSFERCGEFDEAFELFQQSLMEGKTDRGEIFFHCGWCQENVAEGDKQQALSFYYAAAEIARNIECKMNSYFRSGWIKMHEKDFIKASLLFKKAIDLGELGRTTNSIYQDSAYWYAVCLEGLGRYIEALRWYRLIQRISTALDPESRFRQINCLNQIGLYQHALKMCKSFDKPPINGFDRGRYQELHCLAQKETEILESCLADDFSVIKEQ